MNEKRKQVLITIFYFIFVTDKTVREKCRRCSANSLNFFNKHRKSSALKPGKTGKIFKTASKKNSSRLERNFFNDKRKLTQIFQISDKK